METYAATLMRRYGQRVTLERAAGDMETAAFLQPIFTGEETEDGTVTALGAVDGRRWLYLGTEPLEKGDVVRRGDQAFRVRSCRGLYIGEVLSHYRAVLDRQGEAMA